MSKYTTEVRYICETAYGLSESKGADSVDEIIAGCLDKVFNFNFPIFDETYRSVIESKILKHYYTREIGEETVGLWKLRLNTRLNEIMPYYNKLYHSELLEFNPIYSKDITITHKGNKEDNTNNTTNTTSNGKILSNNNSNTNTSNEATNWNIYSDTPQGSLQNIDNETYLTNATKDTTNQKNNSSSFSNGNITSNDISNVKTNGILTSTDSYIETVKGYEGYNPSDSLTKYRDTFLNIDVMVINELEDLFFQLW